MTRFDVAPARPALRTLLPVLLACSCSTASRDVRPDQLEAESEAASEPSPYLRSPLLPAGLCGFDRYLRVACAGAPEPRFAVVLDPHDDPAAAEQLIAAGKLAGLPLGYPFAATFEQMPATDAKRRGLTVVMGLFAEQAAAESYRERHPSLRSELVPLATPDSVPVSVEWIAVELSRSTSAFLQRELEDGTEQPHCVLPRGRVFAVANERIYGLAHPHVPVHCDDGAKAWVPLEATRVDSVILKERGSMVRYQILEISCDEPIYEKRLVQADGVVSESKELFSEDWGDPC
jgi:hypothetical protein